jgi:molybdopterin synthase catalytic subunit
VAAAAHRAEAFDVCRWVVEQVKHRVPIWKKEIFEDGTASWRDNEGRRGPASIA